MNRFVGLTVAVLMIFLGGCGSFIGGWGNDGTELGAVIADGSLQVRAVATFYDAGEYMTDQDFFISVGGTDLVISSIEMGRKLSWSLIGGEYKSFGKDGLYSSELMKIVAGAVRANSVAVLGGRSEMVNIHGRWYKKAVFDAVNGLEYYYDIENNMITLVKSQNLIARAYEFRGAGKAKMVIPAIIEVFEYNSDKVVGDKLFKVKFTTVLD